MKKYIEKQWKLNCIAAFANVICSGIVVGLNLVMIQAIQGIIELDIQRFIIWFSLDFIVWIIYILVDCIRAFFQNKAICAMNNDFRMDLVDSLSRKSYQMFHEKDSGEYISWFTNDVSQIQKLAWEPFFECISAFASILFSILALAFFHWTLLLLSFVAAFIIMLTPKLFSKNIEKYGERNTLIQGHATDQIKDNLLGYEVLKLFDRISLFKDNLKKISRDIEKSNFSLSYKNELCSNVIVLISVMCQLIVNFYIGILSIKGIIIQSAIMGGGNICASIYNNMGKIGKYRLNFVSTKPIFEKATIVDDSEKDKTDVINELVSSIRLDNISYRYNDGPLVLDRIKMKFMIGGKYALVGKSGRGKTTLFKLILGWLRNYNGKIFFDNTDISRCKANEVQKHLSYIAQDVYLFNTSILNNITLFENFSDKDIEEAIRISSLEKDIKSFENGLNTEVGDGGCNLSGGQRQRVAIARAILHKRKVLLVDEGTSALDKENADIIENNLLSESGLTLIIISHHLSEERKRQFDVVYEI